MLNQYLLVQRCRHQGFLKFHILYATSELCFCTVWSRSVEFLSIVWHMFLHVENLQELVDYNLLVFS